MSKTRRDATLSPIRTVSDRLGETPHVLRFWEGRISGITPLKRPGGRRYYRENDIRLLRGISVLIREYDYSTKAVQRFIDERGPDEVMQIGEGKASPHRALPASKGDWHSAEEVQHRNLPARLSNRQRDGIRDVIVSLRGLSRFLRT